MLTALSARPLIELKQRDKSKIECIATDGERLLAGLSTGTLRIYRLLLPEVTTKSSSATQHDPSVPASTDKPAELLREVDKFARYRVEQLALIEGSTVLVSLSNGQLHVHDSQDYTHVETLAKAKGASAFAQATPPVPGRDPATEVSTRLAVAVKRRLQIWACKNGRFEPDPVEHTLVTGIKSITWINSDRVIVGLNASYCIVVVSTGHIIDVVGPGSIGGDPSQEGGRFGASGVASMGYLGLSAPKPMAVRLQGSNALLAKDINTLFIDEAAVSLGRRQIPWSVAPDSLGYSRPYLLALQATKGTLEVRNPETLTVLQTLSVPNSSQIQSKSGRVFVFNEREIWHIESHAIDAQIDTLVEKQLFDEAISLLGMIEADATHYERLRTIRMQKAQYLFDSCKFRNAIDLFSEINAPPERVISMFPPFIAGSASHQSRPLSRELGSTPGSLKSILTVSPRKRRTSRGSESPSAVKSSKQSFKRLSVADSDDQAESRKALEGAELKTATEELRGFLVSARTRLKRVLNPDGSLKVDVTQQPFAGDISAMLGGVTAEPSERHSRLLSLAKLVDTTLFRAYMFISPSFAGPLFRIDNFCDPEVVKEKLLEAGRYSDLIDFLHGKKLHREALELMVKFGKQDDDDDDELQLAGPHRTIAYLETLSADLADLILEFSEWPIKEDPELTMNIFLGDTENAETLPRQKVVDFLLSVNLDLACEYLEHIIDELNDTTPAFHQSLAEMYIQGLKEGKFGSRRADEEKEAQQKQWTEKTLAFLTSSSSYQAYKLLPLLTADDEELYEARAIVLSKMGQHKQALEIYVFKLDDPDKAEVYCNQVYLAGSADTCSLAKMSAGGKLGSAGKGDDDGHPTIYLTLLSLYLNPPPPHETQLDPALALLAKHGSRMPAASTVELIPEILSVKALEAYFRGHIRGTTTLMNQSRIVSGMRSVLAAQAEEHLKLGDPRPGGKEGRNRRVVIDEDRACSICHKRFGGSAIKVLPNNTVVHYGCSAA